MRLLKIMTVTVLLASFSAPAWSVEFATKDEAVAMVKKAVAFIGKEGGEKAYSEISNKSGQFHD